MTVLCTHVREVERINGEWCDRHECRTFKAHDAGKVPPGTGVPEELRLFVGARVVLTANVNR